MIDYMYNAFIVKPILWFAYEICYKELDRGWLEFFFVKIPTHFCFFFAKQLNQNFNSLATLIVPSFCFFFVFIGTLIWFIFFN